MAWEVEIPDVVAGQPVESAWGNQIRDQVVHVIGTVAGLPSTATDGSVAYVEDVDLLYMRRVGAWVPAAGPSPLYGWAYDGGNVSVPTSNTTLVTAPVTIPAGFGNWEMLARYTSFIQSVATSGGTFTTVTFTALLDGVGQGFDTLARVDQSGAAARSATVAFQFRITGTTPGIKAVAVRGVRVGADTTAGRSALSVEVRPTA